jgi:hypothetical protein
LQYSIDRDMTTDKWPCDKEKKFYFRFYLLENIYERRGSRCKSSFRINVRLSWLLLSSPWVSTMVKDISILYLIVHFFLQWLWYMRETITQLCLYIYICVVLCPLWLLFKLYIPSRHFKTANKTRLNKRFISILSKQWK